MPNEGEHGHSSVSAPTGNFHCAVGKKVSIFALCTASVLYIDVAMADSINGIWCSMDGRQFKILYEVVKLGDGIELDGDYDRHHYVFRMPPHGEWGDATVDLVMGSQDVVFVRYFSRSGIELLPEPEKWTRCEASVS